MATLATSNVIADRTAKEYFCSGKKSPHEQASWSTRGEGFQGIWQAAKCKMRTRSHDILPFDPVGRWVAPHLGNEQRNGPNPAVMPARHVVSQGLRR